MWRCNLEPVPNTTGWQTPTKKNNGCVIMRMKQVLELALKMEVINKTSKLPYKCNKNRQTD